MRASLIGVLAGLVLLGGPPRVSAGLSDRIGATFALMADDFIKAFQPLEGVIVEVNGDTVYIDVGAPAGAQVGQEFAVFRKGDVFYHPLTGRALGRYEEILGYAQVRRVFPQYAEATYVPVPDKPGPRAEDGVRITRGRIKVAVTPVLDLTDSQADVRRVPYLFATVLERSKRFQVVDPLTVSDMFANSGIHVEEVLARRDRAVKTAKNLEISGWVVPVLLERRGVIYLDATWISTVTGTPLLSRRRPLLPPSDAEEQRFPWEPRVED